METAAVRLSSAQAFLRDVGFDDAGMPPDALAPFAERLLVLERRVPELPTEHGTVELFRYRVPKVGPDGACSLAPELESEPFDLRAGTPLEALSAAELRLHSETFRLLRLREIVDELHGVTGSDWTGVYRAVSRSAGPVLLKEAYRGVPSRALFPLTAAFAEKSNNSAAALGRRGIVVKDVRHHRDSGLPYYECDPAVLSELCVPALRDGELVGLVDLESKEPARFDHEAMYATALAIGSMVRCGLLTPGR